MEDIFLSVSVNTFSLLSFILLFIDILFAFGVVCSTIAFSGHSIQKPTCTQMKTRTHARAHTHKRTHTPTKHHSCLDSGKSMQSSNKEWYKLRVNVNLNNWFYAKNCCFFYLGEYELIRLSKIK